MGDRPNISSFTVQDERNGTELIDISEYQFKVALAVEHIWGDEGRDNADDPDFVEWDAHFYDTQQKKYTMINMHKCTEQDFAEFHPIVDYQKEQLESMKKKNSFFCLDKADQFGNRFNMTIFGNFPSGIGRYLSIIYRPCVPKQRTEFNKNEKCLIDDIKNQT